MPVNPASTWIYHITDVNNLPGILQRGGLFSDTEIAKAGGPASNIGYAHIKQRRAEEITVDCCDNKFVGEFVPFYYCPRSVMLFTVNQGTTNKPKGCQTEIIHLVSTVAKATELGRKWAISDGNAGSRAATFGSELRLLDELNWNAIRAHYWSDVTFEKQAEFLVEGYFPFAAVAGIGCHNDAVAGRVRAILQGAGYQTPVATKREWYY